MKHYRSSIAFAIAACLLTTAVQAGVVVQSKDCTGCTTAQIEALVPSCEQGAIFITDFAAGRLYEGCYDIAGVSPRGVPTIGGKISPMAQGTKIYHWIQPDAGSQNTFQAYLDVYNNNGHVKAAEAKAYANLDLKPKLSLGDDGYMNAYDTVRAAVNNNVVVNWLETTWFKTGQVQGAGPGIGSPRLDDLLTNLFNTIKTSFLTINFQVQITIVFHDGSQRTYETAPSGNWVVVPGTAIDAHGNPIPENYNAIAGNGTQTYTFNGYPGYDGTNLRTLTGLFGAGVEYNPTDTVTVVICSKKGNEGITCVWPK